jgi:hypothetical protein
LFRKTILISRTIPDSTLVPNSEGLMAWLSSDRISV